MGRHKKVDNIKTVSKKEKISIIRLSNLSEMQSISPGLYYYVEFKDLVPHEVYFFDTRKGCKKEMKFDDIESFKKYVNEEFE